MERAFIRELIRPRLDTTQTTGTSYSTAVTMLPTHFLDATFSTIRDVVVTRSRWRR